MRLEALGKERADLLGFLKKQVGSAKSERAGGVTVCGQEGWGVGWRAAMLRPLEFLTEPDIELLAGAWAAPAAKTDEVPAMDTTSARARTRFITTSLTCRSGLPLTNRQTIVCRASLSPPRARSATALQVVYPL